MPLFNPPTDFDVKLAPALSDKVEAFADVPVYIRYRTKSVSDPAVQLKVTVLSFTLLTVSPAGLSGYGVVDSEFSKAPKSGLDPVGTGLSVFK